MNLRKLIAIILAVAVGYVTIKVAWWVVRHAFSLAIDIMGLVLIVIIAIPLYYIFRSKLLS